MRSNRVIVAVSVLLLCTFIHPHIHGQGKDAIVISAEDLGKEYDKSSKAANKKYDGKVLEVTGTVKFAMQIFSGPAVSLEGSKKSTYSVYCETKDKQPWASVSPGQKVKIVGTYRAGVGLTLRDCEVTALEKNPAVALSAEALAKEFAANKDAATKKYQKKQMTITGTVASTEFLPGGGFTDITLKGSGKLNVICRLHNSMPDFGKSLKAGQMVTLNGPFSYLDGANVRVDMCFPIKKDAGT